MVSGPRYRVTRTLVAEVELTERDIAADTLENAAGEVALDLPPSAWDIVDEDVEAIA